jgi:hypothetical protein
MARWPYVALLVAAGAVVASCGDDEAKTSPADAVREVNRICADAIGEARDEGYLFRELIRYGTKKCERNGAVVLRRAGSRLSFRWRAFDTSVTAVLSPG